MKVGADDRRQSLYAEVTQRVIAELEEGRLPWVQPWDASSCECGMPRNAVTDRAYSGINILILWAAVIRCGHGAQRWLTYRQAQAAGGTVRRGETGVTVCYADRFTPKSEQERAGDEHRDARQVAFLKRFTVFNIDQCDGLPETMTIAPVLPEARDIMPRAEELIAATGANFRIGGASAYYAPDRDYVQVPPRQAFADQINWYRTALHELGHWTGTPPDLPATNPAHSAAPPMRGRNWSPRWQARLPARRCRSSQPFATPIISDRGSLFCAKTTVRSSARQAPRAKPQTFCSAAVRQISPPKSEPSHPGSTLGPLIAIDSGRNLLRARLARGLRSRWRAVFRARLAALAAQADLHRHRAALLGVILRDHRIVGLELVARAILLRRQTMRRQMTTERFVGFAVDQRDDVFFRR